MAKDKAPTMNDQEKTEQPPVKRTALTLDVALYEEMLNDCDLTEEQRQDFLETIWSVIVGFVDLGFEVHPLQQADLDGCGQDLDLSSFMVTDVISSIKGISQKQFTGAADCRKKHKATRRES